MAGETIECTLCEHSIVMNKKECALAHSRAEARLLQQPSTLAPSAHPRGAFLSYGNEVSYTMKKGREASLNPMKSFLALSSVSRPDPYFSENVTCYTLYFIL